MSFKFNFSVDEAENKQSITSKKSVTENISEQVKSESGLEKDKDCSSKMHPALEVIPNAKEVSEELRNLEDENIDTMFVNGFELKRVNGFDVELSLSSESEESTGIITAIDTQSDLVPNVYEGGLKVWECSIDLVNYISSIDVAFRGLKVLEIGCGSALPGLYAYTQGANVYFLDYNSEVLEKVTIPNVCLNTAREDQSDIINRCKFWAGDWGSVLTELNSLGLKNSFDMILTSETIYNVSNYKKLMDMINELSNPNCKIYVAAKSHYFGVGGSTQQFMAMVKEDGTFECNIVKEFTKGVKREIICLEII